MKILVLHNNTNNYHNSYSAYEAMMISENDEIASLPEFINI